MPAATSAERQADAAAREADAARPRSGSLRLTLAPRILDELTGLYHQAAWTLVLASEEARWTRYRCPCQVVQVEVAGIAAVAARLGEAPAERLLGLLGAVLREETRQSDLYARAARWRIQGVLPEQEPGGGARYEERVRDGFGRRLGPDLPLGLIIGMAAPQVVGGFSEALVEAERAMRPGIPPSPGGAVSVPDPARDRHRSTGVHDGLVELGLLREDSLITDDEYRLKRAEILGRL